MNAIRIWVMLQHVRSITRTLGNAIVSISEVTE